MKIKTYALNYSFWRENYMTDAEQMSTAKKFAADWKDKGYEKRESQPFWPALLRKVLDTKPEERDPYMEEELASFPYVNGGLFADEDIEIPRFAECQ